MESKMYEISCANCGIIFWITDAFDERLRKSKKTFYCPQGHSQSYSGDTCEEKLRKKKDELESEKLMHRNAVNRESRADRRISALKGVVTKMRNKQEQEK